MTIEKNTRNTLHHEDASFTTLTNELLNNIKHTGALGVYCYLASKPPGWGICKKHLQNHFECGRKHIDSCFKYLKEIGAIQITMVRDAKGRAMGWNTTLKRKLPNKHSFTQNTQNGESGELSRIPIFHNLENPQSGKRAPINNIYIKIKDNIKPIVDSDESTENDYNVNDESQIPKKSDYSNNHQEYNKKGPETLDGKASSEKSDYFEKQFKYKPDCKNKSLKANKSYKEDDLFMQFYSQYPNKQKPTSAYKAFQKLKPSYEFVAMITADVRKRMENNWKNRHKSKIPHPATYLNSQEWEGEIFPPDNVTQFPCSLWLPLL